MGESNEIKSIKGNSKEGYNGYKFQSQVTESPKPYDFNSTRNLLTHVTEKSLLLTSLHNQGSGSVRLQFSQFYSVLRFDFVFVLDFFKVIRWWPTAISS